MVWTVQDAYSIFGPPWVPPPVDPGPPSGPSVPSVAALTPVVLTLDAPVDYVPIDLGGSMSSVVPAYTPAAVNPTLTPGQTQTGAVIQGGAIQSLTVNGFTQSDPTAIGHSEPGDPWFHFYWPLPGEVLGVSWWRYDDRNNPAIGYVPQIGGGIAEIAAINVPGTPGAVYAPGVSGVQTTTYLASLQAGSGTVQPSTISGVIQPLAGATPAPATATSPAPLPVAPPTAAASAAALATVAWYRRPTVELAIAAGVIWFGLIFIKR